MGLRDKTALLLGLALVGCAPSIHPAFQEAVAEANRRARAAQPWSPDAVIRLSKRSVDELLTSLMLEYAHLALPIETPLGTLEPDLRITTVEVGAAPRCAECLQVAADLSGAVTLTTAFGSSRVPVTASARLDVAFDLPRGEDGRWSLTATPRSLRRLDLQLGGLGGSLLGLNEALQDFLDQQLTAAVGTQTLLDLGSPDLPLVAAALVPGEGSLELRLLTDAPVGAPNLPLGEPEGAAAERMHQGGWSVTVAADSLVALARRAALDAGPLDYAIVAEPRGLRFTGDEFELDLRLWRLAGRGWWRDYQVTGKVRVDGDEVVLRAKDVLETGASPGAALADPLAALGRGVILNSLRDALAVSLPGRQEGALGGVQTVVVLHGVEGLGDALQIYGELKVERGSP